MKLKDPLYSWDSATGIASCILTYEGHTFCGMATCAPEDQDMMSEKTGLTIAESRAVIKLMCYYREQVLAKLAALNQLYYSMKHSQKFNVKSYENIMLQRQISNYTYELAAIRDEIAGERKELCTYIKKKDEFYQSVRKNRTFDKFKDLKVDDSQLVFEYPGELKAKDKKG